MIETTYLTAAASSIMVGVACLSLGWLIGQNLSRNDRMRLKAYAEHEEQLLALDVRARIGRLQIDEASASYLAQVRTEVEADAIQEMQFHEDDEFPRVLPMTGTDEENTDGQKAD